MKYALVQTTWAPQKDMVVELYLMPLSTAYQSNDWPHTTLLTDAMIFDKLREALAYIDDERLDEHKVKRIEDKDLFAARLART